MVLIYASRYIAAPLGSVWDVVADIDREPEFWHGIKSIKNISKTGNIIEREVIIVAFRDFKCREIVELDVKKSIKVEIIEGPIKGKKTISLKSIENNITRIDVEWDVNQMVFLESSVE
jgi:ribosome-associated toxin RatA of RatAB toxin-antitoxin module